MAGSFERRPATGYPRKSASVPAAAEEAPEGSNYNLFDNEYQQKPETGNIWDRIINLLRGKDSGKDDDVTVRDKWVRETGLPDEQMDPNWYQEEMRKLQESRMR